ncbi:MAG: sigma-70 family RNA polymerase sigma factor [Oscillospiraceae bacterium]|nr:sigma-70 family RNA polymerase sigma factor [Oscillospiraceae bacterium]MBQ5335862.1 sigma-70 family RNA polymerase sigma factor [Oscillospiraceae bacterium]
MVSDENILEAFRNSEDEGYRKLMDGYGNFVYTIVTDKVREMASEQDKEECVADIFIETVKECRKQEFNINSLKALITVISKRRATDLFRKLGALKRNTEDISEYSDKLAETVTPENISEKRSEKTALWTEVLKLGKPDSDILILQYFYCRTAGDIAKLLKMTTAAVNKRSQRAREKLKKVLCEKEVC